MEINIKRFVKFEDVDKVLHFRKALNREGKALNVEDLNIIPFGTYAIEKYIQYLIKNKKIPFGKSYNEYKNEILKDKTVLNISLDWTLDVFTTIDVVSSIIVKSKANVIMINDFYSGQDDFEKWTKLFEEETCYKKIDIYSNRIVFIREV